MKYIVPIFIFLFGCEQKEANTVVFVKLEDMSFVAENSLYGNQVLKVPEITQNVMDNGGVLAFIERSEREDRRQLTLSWDNPTYMYLSHGK